MAGTMRNILFGAMTVAGLVLTAASPASAQGRPPPGSYLETCNRAYVDRGNILSAQCQTRNGRWRETRLRLSDCGPGDIFNGDGALYCQQREQQWQGDRRPPPPSQPPRYAQGPSAMVYQDSDYRGDSMALTGDIDNLGRIGMNDSISSMRLGRTAWVMCTDAYFRGQCRTFSGDVRNLDRTGFNDSISSMRRVR